MKEILKTSFMQLLIIYTVLVFLLSFGILRKFVVHFEIFALIIAIFAVLSIDREKSIKISKYWLILAFVLIFLFRIMPYINNSIPLGYDPGIYNYIMQNSSVTDKWVIQGMEPGLFVITDFMKLLGLSVNSILTYGLIFFELLLGISVYFTAKRFFNKSVGIISAILFAVSATQFTAFTYNYCKQIVGMTLLLVSFYLVKLKDEKPSKLIYVLIVASASFLGAVHRSTFLVFGLTFLAYTIYISFKEKKINFENIVLGVSIILLTLLAYVDRIKEAILFFLPSVVTASMGSGTFFDFSIYQLLSLAYLPFALFGIFFLAKKRNFNLLFFYFIINGAIVLFRLFFFNRYIISLDIVMIIMAAYGLYLLLQNKKLGSIITVLLIASSCYLVFVEAKNAKPLINNEELGIIKSLNSTEPNAFVMSTDSGYSPWMLYSQRRVIAPGLFDYDNWTRAGWELFWNNQNISNLMGRYEKPIYVFVGRNQLINSQIFNSTCFGNIINSNGTFVYKWLC
jgi:hypothetical protein